MDKEEYFLRKMSTHKRKISYMISKCRAPGHVVADIGLLHRIMNLAEVGVPLADGRALTDEQRDEVVMDTGMMTLALSIVFFIPVFLLNLVLCSRLDEHGNNTVI